MMKNTIYKNQWMKEWVEYLQNHAFELHEIEIGKSKHITKTLLEELFHIFQDDNSSDVNAETVTFTTCLDQKIKLRFHSKAGRDQLYINDIMISYDMDQRRDDNIRITNKQINN